MRGFRARLLCVTVAVAGLVLALRGQTGGDSGFVVLANVGLPAVDEGAIFDESHTPTSPETLRRAALGAALHARRTGPSGVPYTPGRVIVRFRDEVAMQDRRDAVKRASDTGEIMSRPSYADFDIVRIDPSEDAEAVSRVLKGRPEVQYAQAAYRVHSTFVPNDPYYKPSATFTPGQWNLSMLNLEKAWDIQPQAGSSIIVAVVDTGMAYMNATIRANIRAFRDDQGNVYPAIPNAVIPYSAATQLVGGGNAGRIVAPYDVTSSGANPPLDFEGHGTHVSGTIGQLTNDGLLTAGVAFNVKLMPVKVLSSLWDVLFAGALDVGGSADDVARGIRYAADNGAKIINMSLGSSGPANCATNANQDGCAPVIEAAMRYAVGKGCFISVAAGNEFEVKDPFFGLNPTSTIAEIASRIPGAVSVAAVDRSKAHAYYSSSGSYVEIAAPGGSERGFGRDGFVWQQTFDFNLTDTFDLPPSRYVAPRFDVLGIFGYIGTSMAAPHVSGVAAMLMQQGITDPAAIEAALEKSAVDLGSSGRDNDFGFGLVDARNALRGLGLAK